MKVARRIIKEPPPDIDEVRSDVHPLIVELLFRMLCKEPEERPQTALEVARQLDTAIVDMVVEEGAVSVSDFISEGYSDRIASQTAEVDQLTERISFNPFSSIPVRRRARQIQIGVLLFTLLVGSAVGMWSLRTNRSSSVIPSNNDVRSEVVNAQPEPTAVEMTPSATLEGQKTTIVPPPTPEKVEARPAEASRAQPRRRVRRPSKRTKPVSTETQPKPSSTSARSRDVADDLMGWER